MEPDEIERRLRRILTRTSTGGILKPPSFWVSEVAEERRVYDDLAAGRLWWKGARDVAERGLAHLAAGELGTAEMHVWIATDHYVDALESRIEPKDIKFLSKSAKKRGVAASTADRNRELARAVAAQEALGLEGTTALKAAVAASPTLKTAFRLMSRTGLTKALQKGRSEKRDT